MSISPLRIWLAMTEQAIRPEEQKRLMVWTGTVLAIVSRVKFRLTEASSESSDTCSVGTIGGGYCTDTNVTDGGWVDVNVLLCGLESCVEKFVVRGILVGAFPSLAERGTESTGHNDCC